MGLREVATWPIEGGEGRLYLAIDSCVGPTPQPVAASFRCCS